MTESEILICDCINKLKQNNLTISIAESLTGGQLNSAFTQFPNISSIYCGGIITYQNIVKRRLLNIYNLLTEEDNAVTEDVAKHMAEEVRLKFNTDVGIATTGVAGPDSDKFGNPVGLVYIAIAIKNTTFIMKMEPCDNYSPYNLLHIQHKAVNQALLFLHNKLEEYGKQNNENYLS